MDIGLIGSSGHTGFVTNEFDNPAVSVVGVAPGSDGEDVSGLHEDAVEYFPAARRYDDYETLLEEQSPDVVAVSCQFGDLASVSIAALDADIHVFSEKPLATTQAELEELRSAYESSDAELTAMFGSRYEPWFATAHDLVQNGAIGTVRLLDARKSYKLGTRDQFYRSRESYGGTIPWVGIHAIDWIHWITDGDFESVYGRHSAQYNREHGDLETSGVVALELENEVLATLTVDYYRPETAPTHGDDRLRVVGTDGVLEIRDGEVLLIDEAADGERRLPLAGGGSLFADFLADLQGDDQCRVTAEDAFRVTEASLKAREAADRRRTLSL